MESHPDITIGMAFFCTLMKHTQVTPPGRKTAVLLASRDKLLWSYLHFRLGSLSPESESDTGGRAFGNSTT